MVGTYKMGNSKKWKIKNLFCVLPYNFVEVYSSVE